MGIKKTLTSIVKKVIRKPIRNSLLTGLAALVLTTAVRDNVHFGSIRLNNTQENHYIWGIFPTTEIYGNANGSIRTYGLFGAINSLGNTSTINGNVSGYGLIATRNELGDNSTIKKGDTDLKAVLCFGHRDFRLGTNREINISDYIKEE
ncbi:MAG: hypothetical protein AABW46_02360 [Nanoarchaeota archaeon]